MKWLLTISLICLFQLVNAQRSYIYGVVKDSPSGDEMIGVHIRNLDAGSLTSTNQEGKFKMAAQVGDTLVLSSVGYQTLAWIADSSWFQEEEVEFLLPANTIYLDEVIVGKFPEYERFKQELISMKVVDTTFQVAGLPKVALGSRSDQPSVSIGGPVSALYSAFSRREKEKRQMQRINERKHLTSKAYLKFNREWVGENTKLEGNKLTSFIAYCDFSVDYLADATLFDIHQRMMALLPDFLKEYEKQLEEG